MTGLTFYIRRNKKTGNFRWVCEAANNKKIAWSGESYKTKANCLHGLDLVVNGARTATVIDESGATTQMLGRASRVFPPAHDGM